MTTVTDQTPKNENALKTGASETEKPKKGARPKPGAADYIAGENKVFTENLSPYLPQDLVGGSVPQIPGTEDEAVWNAASQACGTEKVHYSFTIEGGRVWYLACPSSSIASNPDSWCPLAAALPGNSEYWDRETVYLYESEGVASALRWDPETNRMQVFLGASRTILPRVQSMDANFVTINANIADVVPWRSRSLKTEQLARGMVRMLILTGLFVAFVAAAILIFNYTAINMIQRDLDVVKAETDDAAMSLMMKASNIMQSDTIKHMVRVQELLDSLAVVDGTLVKYEVTKGGAVKWEALIPQAFADDFGKAQGIDEKDGRVRVRNTR